MNIIVWIIFGLIAGAIAKAIMPGRDPGGYIITILLGIAGSIVGGFVGRALFNTNGGAGNDVFNIPHLIFAIVGALILLGVYRLIAGRRA
ncbi:MAG: GlsB/YeaQ/YmgE family stress response membrane protein [Pyrinomonadaceae bacterium]